MPRQALLVMDVQDGIVARFDAADALAAIRRALAAARSNEVLVVFVRVAWRAGYPDVSPANPGHASISKIGDAMTEDHPGTRLHDDLERRPDEPIVLKRRTSAFSGSDLEVLLRSQGVDELVLTGISTSGVVLSTVRLASDLDYRLTVLSDACADSDAEVHRVLLEKVFPRQATVSTVDDWVASLT